MNLGDIALSLMALIIVLLVIIVVLIVTQKSALVRRMSGELGGQLEQKHRAMIGDVGGMFRSLRACRCWPASGHAPRVR